MPQFLVEKNAGSFGSEKMPAISRRGICRQFRAGKKVGKFVPEKNASNIGSEQNVGKFEPEKNAGKFGLKKNAGVFGREKIA